MNRAFTFLIVLSGFTIWNSGTLGVFSSMHVVPSFPIIGRLGIWTIIAVYLGAVIDTEVGALFLRKIFRRKKEEVSQ